MILDSIPFPSYGKDSFIFINKDSLDTIDLAVRDKFLWIQGSRGCPFVCTYCINSYTQPLFKKNGKYSRTRSLGNIIEEIKEQLKIVENLGLPKDWKNKVLFIDTCCFLDSTTYSIVYLKNRSSQAKDYKIGLCYFPAKHAALRITC